MEIVVDLSKGKIVDVFPSINENTFKLMEKIEKKIDVNELYHKFFDAYEKIKQKDKNIKIINATSISIKKEDEHNILLQKFFILYKDFVSYNVAKELNTQQLKLLDKLIKNFFNNSFLIKKDLYIYDTQKEDFKIFDKEMFITYIENIQDKFYLYIEEMKQKKDGSIEFIKKYAITSKKFYNHLKIKVNTVKNIVLSINPFKKQTEFYIDTEHKEAILIKNKILLKKPNYEILINVEQKEKMKIFEDYKKLWESESKLYDVLDFIIYGRFLSARKELQLNINAPSSWGKGFFMGVLEDLGVGFTLKQTDFKGDRPSGLNIEKLQNALCLLIDEFKKYNNYLFEINNTMMVEEKFGSRYKINVYARLFFNAQKSESLVGYINEQITNRISFLEIKSDYLLINSVLYNKNKLVYKEVVKKFIYEYFIQKIKELINFGKIKAEEIANKRIQQIISKYKIRAKSTDNLIIETIIEFLNDYKQYMEYKIQNEQEIIYKRFTRKEQELFEKFVFYNKNTQKFILLKYEDTIINILREKLQERDFKKVEYSRAELLNIFETNLKAEYKVTHVTELKTKKRALIIQEQNIFRYMETEEKIVEENQKSQKSCKTNVPYNEIDLINANISYSANILNNYIELKNDKNKILLLTTLNSLLSTVGTLQSFSDIYKTEDISILIKSFIEDKVQLLKQLNLYKNENYIQQKLQQKTFLPF